VDHDFYRLVSPHLVSAIHTAAAFVGKADAEDAVQEAILRAWKAWPSLRQRDSVRSWFLRITCTGYLGYPFEKMRYR
jgi:DNA-directed RNA polymerase specialized sigma24 family protein